MFRFEGIYDTCPAPKDGCKAVRVDAGDDSCSLLVIRLVQTDATPALHKNPASVTACVTASLHRIPHADRAGSPGVCVPREYMRESVILVFAVILVFTGDDQDPDDRETSCAH